MSFRKPLIAAFVALAGALAAGAAHAGSDIHWSIGVNLPVYPNVSVGVHSAPPVYGPRYGYHAPVIVDVGIDVDDPTAPAVGAAGQGT